jgi:phosphatidate cytidylyltransferase
MTAGAHEPVRAAGDATPRSGLTWRLITAAVGIPVVIALVWLGGPIFAIVIAAALGMGFWEFQRSLKLEQSPLTVLLTGLSAALALAALAGDDAVLPTLTAGVLASLLLLIVAGSVPEHLTDWGLGLAAVLYVGLLGQHAVALRELDAGRNWLFLAIFTTFATDTGAYAVGRLIGRHKLAPRLSPGKTIEGAIGGFVAGAVAAWALSLVFELDQPAVAMLALGAAAAVAGQAGDLAESLIKRSAGVKDMGTIFPGHGGVLDRLDSLLFVIPLVYYAVRWFFV